MSTFAEEITRTTASAQQAINEKAADERVKEELRQRKKVEGLKGEFSEDFFKEQIRAAAASARTAALVTVFSYEDEIPWWWSEIKEHIASLGSKIGIPVTFDTDELVPVGSDPIVPYKTYSGHAYFSW
jgi:hypothetical protein